MKISNNVINFAGFQGLWFATVLGAAAGYPQTGLFALLVWLTIHLARLREHRAAELGLIGFAALYGYLADSVLVLSGLIDFPQQTVLGWPSTLWMVVLWAGFATTLRHSLAWLSSSLSLAMLFGMLGGPLAYFAGVRLGALYVDGWYAFIAVALEWVVSMALLIGFNRYLGKTGAPLMASGTTG